MTAVADASVVVSALAGGPSRGAPAREAMRRHGVLHAPHLLDVEFVAAVRGLVRGEKLPPVQGRDAVGRFGALRVRRHPHSGLLGRMWELRENLTPYDAVYVALAEALGLPLLTEDTRIAAAGPLRCDIQVLRP